MEVLSSPATSEGAPTSNPGATLAALLTRNVTATEATVVKKAIQRAAADGKLDNEELAVLANRGVSIGSPTSPGSSKLRSPADAQRCAMYESPDASKPTPKSAYDVEAARERNWQRCWKSMVFKDLVGYPLWEQQLHGVLKARARPHAQRSGSTPTA